MGIRIVLIDDHLILRQGLRFLLEKQADIEVVAEAENGRTGIEFVRTLSPDLAIMDVAMPDLNGIEATRQITTEFPATKVIALSQHADRRFVLEMLRAGALGYLLKICAFEELLSAITAVMANEAYLSPRIANVILTDYLHHLPRADASLFDMLTAREREVFQLIVEGNTNKEIAAALNISVKTVDTHRQQIMSKLDMHNVAELIRFAIREGIVPLQ